MTLHALERLAERAPDIEPEAALAQIRDAIKNEPAEHALVTVSGDHVFEVTLENGQSVFAVVTPDKCFVKTVLVEGMDIETPTGRVVLSRRELVPGIYKLDADAYHADPCPQPSLSSTIAKILLAQTPLHAWTASPRLNPDWEPKDSKTFDIGRAAHRATLGAGSDFCAIPDEILASNGAASTKAAKDFIAEARKAGLTPLKSEEVEQIEAMRVKICEKLAANKIVLDPADSEVAVLGQIEGMWCRAMIDNAPNDPRVPLYDFKTTTDASPEAATRAVMNYGYDIQAAHYLDTWKAVTGEDRLFRFIFQEKTAPYEVSVVEVGPDSLMMARKKIARARAMWANCLNADDWPGYAPGVHRVELPEFFHARWLERESAEADYKARTGKDVLDAARRWQAPENFRHAGE